MVLLKPDATFYPSARMAMEAPPETHAYVAMLNPAHAGRTDGIATVGLDTSSDGYGQIVNVLDLTAEGDELHHFGWNVCSASLCPYASLPISNAATSWCRGCVRRGSTSSTPKTILCVRRSSKPSSRR
jgi:methanethiol oxidase